MSSMTIFSSQMCYFYEIRWSTVRLWLYLSNVHATGDGYALADPAEGAHTSFCRPGERLKFPRWILELSGERRPPRLLQVVKHRQCDALQGCENRKKK